MIVKCRVNPSRGFFLLRYSPLSKFSRSPSVLPILICHPHNHSSLALLGQKGDLANLFSLPIFQKLFSLSLSLLPLRRTSVEWIVLRTPHVGKYSEECTHYAPTLNQLFAWCCGKSSVCIFCHLHSSLQSHGRTPRFLLFPHRARLEDE